MLVESWLFYLLALLWLLFTVLYNKYSYAMRSGYLLVDLPVMLVALSTTFFFECLSSLLPDSLSRQQRLRGKLVLLTGAGSGIGRATSLELTRQGCILMLWDFNERGNAETCKLVREMGGIAYPYTVDVSDRVALEETAKDVVSEYGTVDILVCNAGIASIKRLYKLEHHEIEKLMKVNFLSVVWLTKFFLKQMVQRDSGHIVCVSSGYALRGGTHTSDYAASKGALSSYYISLMEELDKISCRNVHVSVVSPFFVNTPMISPISQYVDKLEPLDVGVVAKHIVRGVRKHRQFIYIPGFLKLISFITFLFPITFSNLINEHQFKGDKFDPIPTNEKFVS